MAKPEREGLTPPPLPVRHHPAPNCATYLVIYRGSIRVNDPLPTNPGDRIPGRDGRIRRALDHVEIPLPAERDRNRPIPDGKSPRGREVNVAHGFVEPGKDRDSGCVRGSGVRDQAVRRGCVT